MSPSKLPLLFLTVFLAVPWTPAHADPCDRFLVTRATLMTSKRAQLAATQLITKEMYESYRDGIFGRARLLGRSLSDFSSYEALVDWRRLEAGKDFFEYGPDSARGAVLAGTGEDAFSSAWKRCLFDDVTSQQQPLAFRGWVEKLEPELATVRLIASVAANLSPPEIVVERSPFVIKVENQPRVVSGRLIVERLVTMKRYPRADVRLVATSGSTTISVVVPSVIAGELTPGPPDGPSRQMVTFVVSARGDPECFRPSVGKSFDVGTIRVTANSPGDGSWKVTKPESAEICVSVTEKGPTNNPKQARYVVILRVDEFRPQ